MFLVFIRWQRDLRQSLLLFTAHGLTHATPIVVFLSTSVATTVYAKILKPWETRGYVSVDSVEVDRGYAYRFHSLAARLATVAA